MNQIESKLGTTDGLCIISSSMPFWPLKGAQIWPPKSRQVHTIQHASVRKTCHFHSATQRWWFPICHPMFYMIFIFVFSFFSYLSKDFLLVPWGKQNLRFDKHKRLRLQPRLFQNMHETWEQLAIRGSLSGPLVEIWNGLFSFVQPNQKKRLIPVTDASADLQCKKTPNLARNTTLHPTESQQFLDQTSPYQSSSAHCTSYSLAG